VVGMPQKTSPNSSPYSKNVTIRTLPDRTGYDSAWESAFKRTFGEKANITLLYASD
jgi:hypothetical protein